MNKKMKKVENNLKEKIVSIIKININ